MSCPISASSQSGRPRRDAHLNLTRWTSARPHPTISTFFLAALLGILVLAPQQVHAFVPAQATNDTGAGAGQNASLIVQYYPTGLHQEEVSYQLVGADSSGVNQGALVHFSEDKLPGGTTTVPWIALVSCDANSTDTDMDHDVFTLAHDRGAVAALLYSTQAVTCTINPEYSDPAMFDQVMDVFVTQSLLTSNDIESEFEGILGNNSKYYWFSPSLLNDSAADIHAAIANHTIPQSGFLFGTLVASNTTDTSGPSDNTDSPVTTASTGSDDSNDSTSGPSNNNGNTSLAMIILYAITGCVSGLFCVVIISGAIRAIRHPERYGPRSGDALGPSGASGPQSRARGLTRAILDTFPVVKFGAAGAEASARPKDIESIEDPAPTTQTRAVRSIDGRSDVAVELQDWNAVTAQFGDAHDESDMEKDRDAGFDAAPLPTLAHTPEADSSDGDGSELNRPSSSTAVPQVVPRPPKAAPTKEKDVVPDAIGRETCPICIVDFEEGDDLRVLPCEGHHRFHRECVDQWLLELSSSCPICRQDFQALQSMMAAVDEEGDHLEALPTSPISGSARPMSSAAARFSRYLRFARRRRQQREDPGGYDATNPPLLPRTMLHVPE